MVSTLVFHHLPREVKKQALKEAHRILKRDGRFLLIDFGKLNFPLKLFYYLEVLFRIPEAKTSKDNIEGKIPEYLKQANFAFKEVSKRYGFLKRKKITSIVVKEFGGIDYLPDNI